MGFSYALFRGNVSVPFFFFFYNKALTFITKLFYNKANPFKNPVDGRTACVHLRLEKGVVELPVNGIQGAESYGLKAGVSKWLWLPVREFLSQNPFSGYTVLCFHLHVLFLLTSVIPEPSPRCGRTHPALTVLPSPQRSGPLGNRG